jgi:hypothetical protein
VRYRSHKSDGPSVGPTIPCSIGVHSTPKPGDGWILGAPGTLIIRILGRLGRDVWFWFGGWTDVWLPAPDWSFWARLGRIPIRRAHIAIADIAMIDVFIFLSDREGRRGLLGRIRSMSGNIGQGFPESESQGLERPALWPWLEETVAKLASSIRRC